MYSIAWYSLFSVFDSWIFEKTFRSKVMAWKSQYANEYVLTTTSYGTDAVTFRLNFPRQGLLWFFQSLTVGYTLVRQRATSLSATTASRAGLCLLLAVFRLLSTLTRALCQSLTRCATALAFVVPQNCMLLHDLTIHVCLYCMIPEGQHDFF